MALLPKRENLINDTVDKEEYYYCDENLKHQHKTKTIYKNKPLIILHLYTLSPSKGFIQKKINRLELKGWDKVGLLPREFRNTDGTKLGFIGKRIKQIVSFVHQNLPKVTKIIVSTTSKTSFSQDSITFNWAELDSIFKAIGSERAICDARQKSAITMAFSKLSNTVQHKPAQLKKNDLVKLFSVYSKNIQLSNDDIDAH